MSPAAQNVLDRLDAARQKWWLFTLMTTAVLAVCTSFGVLLFFMLFDALVRLPQMWLALMFLVWIVLTLGLMVLVGYRLARSQRSLEATARRVEWEIPEIGSDLINVVQLSSGEYVADPAFREAAVNYSAGRVVSYRFEDAAAKESRLRRFMYCMQTPRDLLESLGLLVFLILLAAVIQIVLPSWSSAASRLMKPWNFVPTVGSAGEIKVTPQDSTVLVGASVEITGTIENPDGRVYDATLYVTPEGEAESAVAMTADESGQVYKASLPTVLQNTRYRLEIGDSQSGVYQISVVERPAIEEVSVTLHYPPYLNRPDETFTQRDADIEAPECTEAELRIRPRSPIAAGHILAGGAPEPCRIEDGGMMMVAKIFVDEDKTFTIHMTNEARQTDPDPRVNRVHVIKDKEPEIEFLKPTSKEKVAPGGSVPVTLRGTDDHGVGRVRLEMRVLEGRKASPEEAAEASAEDEAKQEKPDEKKAPFALMKEWTKFEGTTTVLPNHRLELTPEQAKPGQFVELRAVVFDNREYNDWGKNLKPQQKERSVTLEVASPDEKASAALAEGENIRTAILKILESQTKARVAAGVLVPKNSADPQAAAMRDLNQLLVAAGSVRSQQVDIQNMTQKVVKSISDADREDRQVIKRILNQLAFGEMVQAVGHCDELTKQKSVEGIDSPAGSLVAVQARIIEVLRKLLDVARQGQEEVLSEMQKRPGGDLPDDTRKRLEEAKNKLEEMLKMQKKVIEATENLAKKPTEDFSEEDEQLLKQLAAKEDEFAKFMKDLHSDLSKLPEQDFANASVAKEKNEIQTEIKMAEDARDALLKKSADIAVPLEQLGYERAEEIKTNLEKWLPDTPDREKWSQEESLSDADKEAPMAELPGELEDLIGDLMEEEEDLFDEMEDVSSSAADSLDKGAAWDVADGPISNMSAKGATGNRLPNTSEIGGRAGEGRQGKSSGEFVGDEAVGKGGRKTPSRLTPDPIMKGQIKDHSKEATGGATGGGKESGEGGEGLEGPTPNAPGKRDLSRLAGKQADLRNKAEGVDLQFQISNFHHTDLKKLIEMMKQVEADLKAGNYQNALRQRQVLADKMGNVKQYLEGEFEVRKDVTANLPGEIQKEILGGMQDPSPSGWEELNRLYFERLSVGGSEPAGR